MMRHRDPSSYFIPSYLTLLSPHFFRHPTTISLRGRGLDSLDFNTLLRQTDSKSSGADELGHATPLYVKAFSYTLFQNGGQ